MSSDAGGPPSVLDRRCAGVLLHITSLPGGIGHGDLGPDAYRFVDFLADTGVRVWQVLPLGLTHRDGSPYQCLSAHAGNNLMIDLNWLAERGWLQLDDPARWASPWRYRYDSLRQAFIGFYANRGNGEWGAFEAFCEAHGYWLDNYALFIALRQRFGRRPWQEWPAAYRDRDLAALQRAQQEHALKILRVKFEQYVFFQQWHALRTYANGRGVKLFGDVPIFVAGNSADVWARREYFKLDEYGRPAVVAGVPPDYFSATGQRWGNPHYHWERMQADGFQWWLERMRTQRELFDLVRIDHFRGLEACWEIPADEPTAINGHWVSAPGDALLEAMYREFGTLPLVAENLGIITEEVEALRQRFNLPGMLILQFAFDGSACNPYLPHRHGRNSVVYTGTHDNDTTLGWYQSLPAQLQSYVLEYLGFPAEPMPWPLVRAALASTAELAVLPMQDLLGLGEGYRMNTPGTTENNWRWRFQWEELEDRYKSQLSRWVRLYGRA